MADLVAIDLPAGKRFVEELDRAWSLGEAVLPLQQEAPEHHREELALRMGAARLLTRSGTYPLENARPVDDGVALVMLTSGSTGEPKGVLLDHAAVEYSAFAGATALGVGEHTHWVACLPLSHVGGLSVVTRAVLTGAGLSVLERFSPVGLDRALQQGATHVSLVPTALRRTDPAPWQKILVGGSAIPPGLPVNCVATYGMTETMGGVVYDGLPLNGVEVRIAGAPADEQRSEGLIQIRTPTLMRGYRSALEPGSHETASAGTPTLNAGPGGHPVIDDNGWFTTGDLGSLGADRRLEVRGRADDLIVTGGEKVWPTPVESRLCEHATVAEAAVFGRPDAEWGQAVTALIVTEPGTTPPATEELRQWVAATLPKACCPKEVRVVARLPRTALGKIVRSALR